MHHVRKKPSSPSRRCTVTLLNRALVPVSVSPITINIKMTSPDIRPSSPPRPLAKTTLLPKKFLRQLLGRRRQGLTPIAGAKPVVDFSGASSHLFPESPGLGTLALPFRSRSQYRPNNFLVGLPVGKRKYYPYIRRNTGIRPRVSDKDSMGGGQKRSATNLPSPKKRFPEFQPLLLAQMSPESAAARRNVWSVLRLGKRSREAFLTDLKPTRPRGKLLELPDIDPASQGPPRPPIRKYRTSPRRKPRADAIVNQNALIPLTSNATIHPITKAEHARNHSTQLGPSRSGFPGESSAEMRVAYSNTLGTIANKRSEEWRPSPWDRAEESYNISISDSP